jgi:hypothetical protein
MALAIHDVSHAIPCYAVLNTIQAAGLVPWLDDWSRAIILGLVKPLSHQRLCQRFIEAVVVLFKSDFGG